MIFTISLSPEAALAAAIWIFLVGAGLMPALVVIARLAFRFAVNEVISTVRSEFIKWAAITTAALALGLSASPAPATATEKSVAAGAIEVEPPPGAALDTAIAQAFARVVTAGTKPLPVLLLDIAARIYTSYRIHKVATKANEAARIALAAMTELVQARAEIEAGRLLSEQGQRSLHIRLEAYAAQIEGLKRRVTEIEQRTNRVEQKADNVMRIVTRPGCPPLHAWDKKLNRCTNRQ